MPFSGLRLGTLQSSLSFFSLSRLEGICVCFFLSSFFIHSLSFVWGLFGEENVNVRLSSQSLHLVNIYFN